MSCAVAVIIADLGLTAARRTWLGATTRSLVVISAGVRPAAVASDTLAWAARARLAGATLLLVGGSVQREHSAVTLLAQQIRRRHPGTSPGIMHGTSITHGGHMTALSIALGLTILVLMTFVLWFVPHQFRLHGSRLSYETKHLREGIERIIAEHRTTHERQAAIATAVDVLRERIDALATVMNVAHEYDRLSEERLSMLEQHMHDAQEQLRAALRAPAVASREQLAQIEQQISAVGPQVRELLDASLANNDERLQHLEQHLDAAHAQVRDLIGASLAFSGDRSDRLERQLGVTVAHIDDLLSNTHGSSTARFDQLDHQLAAVVAQLHEARTTSTAAAAHEAQSWSHLLGLLASIQARLAREPEGRPATTSAAPDGVPPPIVAASRAVAPPTSNDASPPTLAARLARRLAASTAPPPDDP